MFHFPRLRSRRKQARLWWQRILPPRQTKKRRKIWPKVKTFLPKQDFTAIEAALRRPHDINFLLASFCAQLSSSRWKSSVSSPRPPYPASTLAPRACCPRTSLMAGKSAPSTTLKPPRTTSLLLSQERSSPSWTTGDFTVSQQAWADVNISTETLICGYTNGG